MEMNLFFRRTSVVLTAGIFLLGAGCWQKAQIEVTDNVGALPPDGLSATEIIDQAKKNPVNNETMVAANQNRPAKPTAPVGILPADRIENKIARIQTNKGEIVFELYATDAPKTVSNFVALAESGYFDGLTYHRVVPSFVIQGGDPDGTGRGGPGYKFEDEPVTRNYLAGTVAMANAGPNTNGSQYFICLEDLPSLPKSYTIFGQVISGMDVVSSIAIGDVMTSVTIESK
ncbi:MAG: peptidylprolyl isomerase [Patescibacteria group bacterium]